MKQQEKKKKYCYRFWPFNEYDHGHMAEYLEDKERKGLRLDSIQWLQLLARYEKVEPCKARYATDLLFFDTEKEKQSYLQLCDEAGWICIREFYECAIFREREGTNPAPLHTNEEEKLAKAKRLETKILPNYFIILSCMIVNCYMRWADWRDDRLIFYLSDLADQILTILYVLVAVGISCSFLQHLWRLRHIRGQIKRKESWSASGTVGRTVLYSSLKKAAVIAGAFVGAFSLFVYPGAETIM